MKEEQKTVEFRKRRNTAIGFVVGMLFGGLVDSFTGDAGWFTLLGMIGGSILGYSGLGRIEMMEYPPGVLARVIAAFAVFVVTLIGSRYALDRVPDGIFKRGLPVVPAVAGCILILAIGYGVTKLDELQRRIQLEAIAIAFAITAAVVLTAGLLGATSTSQPSWMFVLILMTAAWIVGKVWTRWKYR